MAEAVHDSPLQCYMSSNISHWSGGQSSQFLPADVGGVSKTQINGDPVDHALVERRAIGTVRPAALDVVVPLLFADYGTAILWSARIQGDAFLNTALKVGERSDDCGRSSGLYWLRQPSAMS